MMVVLSLSIITRAALPELRQFDILDLEAQFFGDNLPPVRIAISSSISLRRSPKPGALTAATLSVPRSLFTTSAASASPSTSSAIINSGCPALHDTFEQRHHLAQVGDLLFVQQDERLLESRRSAAPDW